jgi:threonine/homoserine/homoserine lactone efflux protein
MDVVRFLPVALAIMLAPGPDFALITRHTLVNSRHHGLFASFGVSSGLLVHTAAAVVGLSAVLAASATLFTAVKLAGAAYLVVLGVSAIWKARKPGTEQDLADEAAVVAARTEPLALAFRQGALTNVLNPKVAIMFVSLLPQFVDPDASVPLAVQTAALAAVFIVLNQVYFALYTGLLARFGDVMRRDRAKRWLDRISGTVLIGLGLRVAVQH